MDDDAPDAWLDGRHPESARILGEPEPEPPLPRQVSFTGETLRAQPALVVVPRRVAFGRVWADPTRLRQLLLNRVSNGVKYKRRGAMAEVSLPDNGLGIEAGRIGQRFQPFDRIGRETSGIEGTGLGLALVKLLVEQMGGAVEVDRTEGAGSEFRLVLPLTPWPLE